MPTSGKEEVAEKLQKVAEGCGKLWKVTKSCGHVTEFTDSNMFSAEFSNVTAPPWAVSTLYLGRGGEW